MIELRNSTGALDFSRVTPEAIAEMDEPCQIALRDLMVAADKKEAAVARRAVATRRVNDAVVSEENARLAHEDASSPIPFSVAALEETLGRPLNASEMRQARDQHAARVRGLLEQRARQAVVEAYNKSH